MRVQGSYTGVNASESGRKKTKLAKTHRRDDDLYLIPEDVFIVPANIALSKPFLAFS
jgi:hypothetical protein